MQRHHTFGILLALAAGSLASCGDSPTQPRLASAYRLATVNDLGIPAAVDSSTMDSRRFYSRVVGRSIEILSADSARYSWATDTVERLPDGSVEVWATDCTSLLVAYRRSGERLILEAAAPNLPPSLGFPSQPAVNDTLQVQGDRLVHLRREAPTISHPEGRVLRFEYQEGRPAASVCG